MTTIYSVSHVEGVSYHPTLAEARRVAAAERKHEAETGEVSWSVEVQRHTIDHRGFTKRDLFCRLLNGERWAHSSEDLS